MIDLLSPVINTSFVVANAAARQIKKTKVYVDLFWCVRFNYKPAEDSIAGAALP